jgi:hypothetical protein
MWILNTIKIDVFWYVMPCTLAKMHRIFGGSFFLRYQGFKMLQRKTNIENPLLDSLQITDLVSNPGGSRVFLTHPDWHWSPPGLLCSRYRVCFAGVKRPGRGFDHPSPSSAEGNERVEL